MMVVSKKVMFIVIIQLCHLSVAVGGNGVDIWLDLKMDVPRKIIHEFRWMGGPWASAIKTVELGLDYSNGFSNFRETRVTISIKANYKMAIRTSQQRYLIKKTGAASGTDCNNATDCRSFDLLWMKDKGAPQLIGTSPILAHTPNSLVMEDEDNGNQYRGETFKDHILLINPKRERTILLPGRYQSQAISLYFSETI
ncbi:hypothetical protein [Vibrio nomapromontoriensis]|uniref:hypothetical protein n=1 Tax=Vibrio nomapromontoriensis TaxID=2910246 RepID=UPI003D12D9E8